MTTTGSDSRQELLRRLRALPAKRRNALVALLRQQGVDLSGRGEMAASAGRKSGVLPSAPRPDGPMPLSFTQQRLWFLAQLDGASPAYNVPVAMRLRGPLDRDALLSALAAVVARHEVLRTRFTERDGVPGQLVGDGSDITVGEEELTDLDALEPLCREEAATPFDLERGPLIRMRLLRHSAEEHYLLVTTHHTVSDGWSIGVFHRDLVAAYEAYQAGHPPAWAPLPVQYADAAAWERDRAGSEEYARQVAYWREQLAGVDPRLTLPTDRPRPQAKTYSGAVARFTCPVGLLEDLRRLAKAHDVTLYMVLLAAHALLLHRHTRQTDLAVGTVVAGRNRRELEGLVGFFANTLVMRTDLSGDPTLPELFARVKRTALAAYAHQDVPFEAVVDALDTERSLAHTPVFQTLLVLQEAETGQETTLPGLDVSAVDIELGHTKFDLTLDLRETPGGLLGTVEYNTDLYDLATVERFTDHYTRLLTELAADPAVPVSGLNMIGPSERHTVLEEWNATAQPFSQDLCLHELFEAEVGRHPDRTALVDAQGSWTYAELDTWATRVAGALQRRGVGPDTLVGLHTERSAAMVAGILGTLKAGGAYVPLEPSYPAGRLTALAADSEVPVVLTQPHLDTGSLTRVPHLVALHRDGTLTDPRGQSVPDAADAAAEPGRVAAEPGNLAYVIHTSGSTGRPKGVMIEHRAAVNRIEWMQNAYRLTEDDVVLQKTPYSFDVSVWEFFWPLLTGARLAVAEPGAHQDPARLLAAVREFGVTTLHFVPSMLRAVVAEADWSRCATVRQVFCSGEALPPELCTAHYARHTAPLHNLYGPTEAAVDVSHWTCPADSVPHRVPIGRPIQNIRLYVLDERGEPQGVGCVGELYIAGVGLARGYLRQPELTREVFVPDPYQEDPNARMYRTGDLVRWLPDGELEYLGRSDDQVKIRGLRIEPGEIEHRLTEHPAVRSCAVLVREDVPGDPRLVAYVVPAEGGQAQDLREALGRHLEETMPAHLVPGAFVTLESLPVTAHGKLDRRALPAPDIEAYARRAYVPPRTPTERLLARVWAELLGFPAERVSAEDNFFALGGHSLLLTVLVARLRESGLTATVRDVFASPTLTALASRVDTTDAAPRPEVPPNLIPEGCAQLTPELLPLVDLTQEQVDALVATVPGGAANIQDVYPLLSTQEGILFHHLLVPDHDPYLVCTLYEAEDDAAADRFVRALRQVVDRHDVMRTAIVTDGLPDPIQVVHRTVRLPVERVLLAAGGDAREQAQELLARPHRMDVAAAPLLRLLIAEDPDSPRRYLVLTAHHLIEDASSLRLTMQELAVHLSGRTELLEPPAPYRDFVAHTLPQQDAEGDEEFFRGMLGDVVEPTNPFGLADVHGDARHVTRLRRQLPAELTVELRAQAARLRLSPAVLFHAAWARVVAACSGQDDVVFGSVMSGRLQGVPGAERMLGNFINTLPLRTRLAGATVRELVADVDAGLRGLIAREHVPLRRAQGCSGMDGDAPLFSAVANFRHFEAGRQDGDHPRLEDQGVRFVAAADGVNYPISVSLDDFGTELSLDLHVDERVDAEAIAEYLRTALDGLTASLAADGGESTSALDLPVLPEAEQNRLLYEWNETEVPLPAPTLTAAFSQQAARTPRLTALVSDEHTVTYAELDASANQLAHWLIARGAGPETLVGIRMERTPDLFTAIYGVLKSGAGYLPLDPDLPPDRHAAMTEDAAPLLILDTLPDTSGLSRTAPAVPVRPDHPAYVLYTSGTTGSPKGVVITHRAAMNWLAWDQGVYRGGEGDRVLFKTSIGFDVSIKELFWPLQVGGTVVIARPGGQKDPEYLATAVREHGVTDIDFVPSMLAEFLSEPAAAGCTGLRRLEATGEPLPVELAERVTRLLPDTELYNLCGPTEVGGALGLYGPYLPEPDVAQVPIGAPVWNTQVYVLDSAFRLLPRGVPGELYVAGDQLARGFLGRPGLTAERFIANPFTPGTRMYRTGDLVRWRSDGLIEHLGRVDDQVKVRGFRVEPGEVENALHSHPDVHRAVVLPRGAGAARTLVAYLAPTQERAEQGEETEPLARVLKNHLAALLPDYMVPTAFVVLDSLPTNRNGKVDRGALPEPGESDLAREEHLEPRNAAERALCRLTAEVLGVAQVGLRDGFFALGGHSLLATRLSLRVKKELGAELPLAAIFGSVTMEEMAAALHGADRIKEASTDPDTSPAEDASSVQDAVARPPEPTEAPAAPGQAEAGSATGPEDLDSAARAPLSRQQRDLWFLDRPEHQALAHDNVQLAFRLSGPLDRDAFVRAVAALVERHPILRTGYHRHADGTVTQREHPSDDFAVTLADAPGEGVALDAWLRAERGRPFEPEGPYPFRVHLLTVSAQEHLVVLTRPWGIFDGWSVGLVLGEQLALYRAFRDGSDPRLRPLPLSYAEYARRQAEAAGAAEHEATVAYWRQALAGLPDSPGLRTDYPRGPVPTHQGASVELAAPADVLDGLRHLARDRGATTYMALLAAYAVLLGGRTDADDLVVGSPYANRAEAELEGVVGYFVTLLPVRLDLAVELPFTELLARTRRTVADAQEHAGPPLPELLRALFPAREPGQPPLIHTTFNLLPDQDDDAVGEGEEPRITLLPTPADTARYDLNLVVRESAAGLSGYLEYGADLFSGLTAADLARQYERLLTEIVRDPGATVGDLRERAATADTGAPTVEPAKEQPPTRPKTSHRDPSRSKQKTRPSGRGQARRKKEKGQ